MKTLCIILATALLAGCSAPMVLQRDRTRALSWTMQAAPDQVWAAATNVASRHPFQLMKLDSTNRFLATGTRARYGSDGELIGLWLTPAGTGTRVEVSSKPVSLLALGNEDWRHPLAQRICDALNEPTPPAPPPLKLNPNVR